MISLMIRPNVGGNVSKVRLYINKGRDLIRRENQQMHVTEYYTPANAQIIY